MRFGSDYRTGALGRLKDLCSQVGCLLPRRVELLVYMYSRLNRILHRQLNSTIFTICKMHYFIHELLVIKLRLRLRNYYAKLYIGILLLLYYLVINVLLRSLKMMM